MPPLPPALARRFEIVRSFVGGEGESCVVRTRDGECAELLLKILPPDADLREAELLASLEHERVPRILEVGRTEDGAPFVLRSFVPGRSLADVQELEADAAIELASQLLEILAFVHLRGVLHLDLKPANIIAEETDDGVRYHLVDFGLGGRRGGMARGGTLFFAAPEQLLGLAPDHRSDLFALGATLFAMVHPVKGGLASFLRCFPRDDFFAAIGVPPATLPSPLDRLLPRLVATRPERRFADAQEALESLRRGSGRPSLASLALDPVAVHGQVIDALLDHLPAKADLIVSGGEADDRRVVALHVACRLGDVREITTDSGIAQLRRGDVDARELALGTLDLTSLTAHLRDALELDAAAAELAARRLIDAGCTSAAGTSRRLVDLAARGELVPDGVHWTWPDALSGRLALASDPDESPATPDALREAAAAGRIEGALRRYRAATTARPDEERPLRTALVEGLLLAGEPVRALPLAHDLPVQRARALADSGRIVEARAAVTDLTDGMAQPTTDEVLRLRAWLAWQGGMLNEARATLAMLDRPDRAENRIVRGLLAAADGDGDEARRLLTAALAKLETDRRPFLRAAAATALGDLARSSGDLELARARHGEALELFRGLGNARHTATAALNLGVIEKDLGDTHAARESLRRARSLYARVEDRAGELLAEANLGIVQLADGDARSALERFDAVRPQLRALGVQHVDALLGALTARACVLLGERTRALREIEVLSESRDPRVLREIATARAALATPPAPRATVEKDMTRNEIHQDAIPRTAFRTFLAVNRRIATETRLEDAMRSLLDAAQTLTGARAGYLLLERDGVVRLEVGDVRRGGTADSGYSRSLANKAIREQRTLTSEDALGDRDLMEMPSVRDLRVRSALCVPFRSSSGAAGALYVEHPGRAGAFGPNEAEFLEILGDQAAIAVDRMLHEEELATRLERSQRDLAVATRSLKGRGQRPRMIGDSPPMRELRRQIETFAGADLPVLIHGETGTGKELVARTLHDQSAVRNGPFVSENCSAIPPDLVESELFGHVKGAFTGADQDHAGLFELANGGTLFLDEVGDMPAAMQVKLLRALQEQSVRRVGSGETIPVKVRLVTATHKDLAAMIAEGSFREDLYYRIAAGVIDVPPLRNRGDDILKIARAILDRLNAEHRRSVSIDADTGERLAGYSWPGNVRELEHVLARAFLLGDGDALSLVDMPRDSDATLPGSRPADWPVLTIEEATARTIQAALAATGGDKSKAARILGISRTALYDRLKRMQG